MKDGKIDFREKERSSTPTINTHYLELTYGNTSERIGIGRFLWKP
jgi:hypothetical protein